MFNIVEKRGFFFVCAFISLAIVISSFFNYEEGDWILFCTNVFLTISLLGLFFFIKKEQKELMKVFLTTLIVCTVFSFVQKFYMVLIWAPEVIKKNNNIDVLHFMSMFIIFLCVCTIYINHCIMNYTNLPSKIAININKVLVLLILIITIIEKCKFVIMLTKVNNLPAHMFFRFIDTSFLVLAIVSAEAFINKKREEKTEQKIS